MDFFIVFAKQTMHKQVPFIDKLKYEKELRQLQIQLNDKTEQLEAREAKIIELERLIRNIEGPLPPLSQLNQQQNHPSFDQHALQEQAEAIRRLSEELATREQERTHLDSLTKDLQAQFRELQSQTQTKDEENCDLRNRVGELEGYLTVGMRDFDFLCDQNRHLRERIMGLQKEKAQVQNHVAELQATAMKFDEMKLQRQTLMREWCSMQTEDSFSLKERQEKLREELQVQGGQLERAKDALNNYDWKLFCLETELDLWAKQCKHLKSANEDQNAKINHMEQMLLEKQRMIFQEKQENKLISEENIYLAEQLQKSQVKVGQLTVQVRNLAEKLQENEEEKVLSYRLKEKDEELAEILLYLKQKISEVDHVKQRNSALEKELEKQKLKSCHFLQQNSQFEQIIVQEEEALEAKTKKIKELQKSLEDIRKQVQDNTILDILRQGEWAKLKEELEDSLSQQNDKVNRLKFQLAEKDQVTHKNVQLLAQKDKDVEIFSQQFREIKLQLKQVQQEAGILRIQHQTMKDQFQSLTEIFENLCRELNCRQSELKASQEELQAIKKEKQRQENAKSLMNGRLRLLEAEIEDLHKKITELYKQKYQQQFEIDLLTRENTHYKMLNSKLREKDNRKEEYISGVKTEAARLLQVTKGRIEQLNQLLTEPILQVVEKKEDETTQFQVLQEERDEVEQRQEEKKKEDFQLMECRLQQRHNDLRAIINEYWMEVTGIAKRLEL